MGGAAHDTASPGRRSTHTPSLPLLGVPRPRPRFGHDALFDDGGPLPLLGCFHPSQQNTFTGKLTAPMTDAVLLRARALAERAPRRSPRSGGRPHAT